MVAKKTFLIKELEARKRIRVVQDSLYISKTKRLGNVIRDEVREIERQMTKFLKADLGFEISFYSPEPALGLSFFFLFSLQKRKCKYKLKIGRSYQFILKCPHVLKHGMFLNTVSQDLKYYNTVFGQACSLYFKI